MRDLHEVFAEDMEREAFVETLERLLAESGWLAWTLIAETKRGVEPVGIATGWLLGRTLITAKGVFFPWASNRNIRETLFHFFDSMRKVVVDEEREIPDPLRYLVVLEFAHFDHKRFYESMASYGIMRRVGHVNDLEDKPSVLFQTRSPVK